MYQNVRLRIHRERGSKIFFFFFCARNLTNGPQALTLVNHQALITPSIFLELNYNTITILFFLLFSKPLIGPFTGLLMSY